MSARVWFIISLWHPRQPSSPCFFTLSASGDAASKWQFAHIRLATGWWTLAQRIPFWPEPCGSWHDAQSDFATG